MPSFVQVCFKILLRLYILLRNPYIKYIEIVFGCWLFFISGIRRSHPLSNWSFSWSQHEPSTVPARQIKYEISTKNVIFPLYLTSSDCWSLTVSMNMKQSKDWVFCLQSVRLESHLEATTLQPVWCVETVTATKSCLIVIEYWFEKELNKWKLVLHIV